MALCMVLGNGRHPEVLKQGQYTCGLHPRLTYLDLTKCLSLCVCTPVFHSSHRRVSRCFFVCFCLCFISGLSTWRRQRGWEAILPCLQEWRGPANVLASISGHSNLNKISYSLLKTPQLPRTLFKADRLWRHPVKVWVLLLALSGFTMWHELPKCSDF